jgi:hypothetical protein
MTMTIPTLPVMPAGYVVQASDMNDLAYAATFLLTKPLCHVTATGTQSVTTSFVAIAYSIADINTDGMWSSGNTSLLTIQTPGFYKVTYSVDCVGTSTAYTTQTVVQCVTGANNPLGGGVSLLQCLPGYGTGGVSASVRTASHAEGIIPYYLYELDTVAVQVKAVTAGMTLSTYVPCTMALEFVSA